jgi:hypothetical protein
MSTRSIIARAAGDGFVDGTYVHSDGYPSGRGPILQTLFARGRLDEVIDERWGWSFLDPEVESNEYRYAVGTMVPGIGNSYRGHDPSCADYRFAFPSESWDAFDTEWAYAVNVDTGKCAVYTVAGEAPPTLVAIVDLTHQVDWEAIESKVYA